MHVLCGSVKSGGFSRYSGSKKKGTRCKAKFRFESGWRLSNSAIAKEIWRLPIHPLGHMVSDMSSSATVVLAPGKTADAMPGTPLVARLQSVAAGPAEDEESDDDERRKKDENTANQRKNKGAVTRKVSANFLVDVLKVPACAPTAALVFCAACFGGRVSAFRIRRSCPSLCVAQMLALREKRGECVLFCHVRRRDDTN